MTWKTLCIAACWLLASALSAQAADQCRWCHTPGLSLSGAHRGLACRDCHQSASRLLTNPADRSHGSAGCVGCHRGYQQMYSHAMGTRAKEKAFIERSYGKRDRNFEQKNCSSCHLQGCLDCHGEAHAITRPKQDSCSRCHKGYYVGWDYFGRAPRDEHARYQRGDVEHGETFLKMRPDVHYQRGLTCNSCHSMQSLVTGRLSAKSCSDCHRPSPKVLEHRIPGHLEKMECVACHTGWAAQEYGTFFLQFTNGTVPEPFDMLTVIDNGYARSAYLKRQDLPPLGFNSRGLLAPIRPQFIAYYSKIRNGRAVGTENQLLAAEWRAFTPHTIQRGSVTCDGCHDNPRRFLLEPPQDRIYDLSKDGMTLYSFWNQAGQKLTNGRFMDQRRYQRMTTKTDAYKRAYVEKWKQFARPDAASSPR